MKVLYLVSSNKEYFGKTFPVFMGSIPKVKREKFVFIVNGSDKVYQEEVEGAKVKYVMDNSFEYSPLIDLVNHPQDYDCDFVFLLYDTCSLGKSFFKKVEKFNPSFETIAVSSLENNFGLLKKGFLLSKKNFILSMKNCSKEKQLLNKGKLFRIAHTKTTFQTTRKILTKKDVYSDNINRVTEYYEGIDLYKYKFSGKENYESLEPLAET